MDIKRFTGEQFLAILVLIGIFSGVGMGMYDSNHIKIFHLQN